MSTPPTRDEVVAARIAREANEWEELDRHIASFLETRLNPILTAMREGTYIDSPRWLWLISSANRMGGRVMSQPDRVDVMFDEKIVPPAIIQRIVDAADEYYTAFGYRVSSGPSMCDDDYYTTLTIS